MRKPVKKIISRVHCANSQVEGPRFHTVELYPLLMERVRDLNDLAVEKNLPETLGVYPYSEWSGSNTPLCASLGLMVTQTDFWFIAFTEDGDRFETEHVNVEAFEEFLAGDDPVFHAGIEPESLNAEDRALVDKLTGAEQAEASEPESVAEPTPV